MGENKNRQSVFHFRQFSVRNTMSAMKVGTDGVLLGAWADCASYHSALDVGAGTALVSLMLAQRYPQLCVTALELDAAAVSEAALNIAESPWAGRIDVVQDDFLTFDAQGRRYDIIVSNPPFFVNALKSDDMRRSLARHAFGLDYKVLIKRAPELLTHSGRLAMILPAEFEEDVCFRATLAGMSVSRLVRVFTRPSAPAKRILVELDNTTSGVICRGESLIIGSEEYLHLTREFYL